MITAPIANVVQGVVELQEDDSARIPSYAPIRVQNVQSTQPEAPQGVLASFMNTIKVLVLSFSTFLIVKQSHVKHQACTSFEWATCMLMLSGQYVQQQLVH